MILFGKEGFKLCWIYPRTVSDLCMATRPQCLISSLCFASRSLSLLLMGFEVKMEIFFTLQHGSFNIHNLSWGDKLETEVWLNGTVTKMINKVDLWRPGLTPQHMSRHFPPLERWRFEGKVFPLLQSCGLTVLHTCSPEALQNTLSWKGIDTSFNEAENEEQSAAIHHRPHGAIHHR